MSDPEPVREEPTKEIVKEITKETTGAVAETTPVTEHPAGSETEEPGDPGEKAAQDAREAQKRKTLFIAIGAVVVILAAAIGAFCLLSMPTVMMGDTVAIYYNESFDNGTVYISNMNTTYPPLVFTLGNSSVISGVQDAVIGMSPGETKRVNIPYTRAYGAYDPGFVQTINRTGPIANISFEPGQSITVHDKATDSYSTVKILYVTPSTITWDANNPLAGYNLTFTIELANLTRANTAAATA